MDNPLQWSEEADLTVTSRTTGEGLVDFFFPSLGDSSPSWQPLDPSLELKGLVSHNGWPCIVGTEIWPSIPALWSLATLEGSMRHQFWEWDFYPWPHQERQMDILLSYALYHRT